MSGHPMYLIYDCSCDDPYIFYDEDSYKEQLGEMISDKISWNYDNGKTSYDPSCDRFDLYAYRLNKSNMVKINFQKYFDDYLGNIESYERECAEQEEKREMEIYLRVKKRLEEEQAIV